jgi:hypothetical protein
MMSRKFITSLIPSQPTIYSWWEEKVLVQVGAECFTIFYSYVHILT